MASAIRPTDATGARATTAAAPGGPSWWRHVATVESRIGGIIRKIAVRFMCWSRRALPLAATLVLVACHSRAARPPIVQPGAPGEPSRVVTARQAADLSKVDATAADVRFMQGMIGHHAQALEMTELLRSRSASDDMKKLAQRIDVSQADEIKM